MEHDPFQHINLLNMPPGVFPEIIPLTSPQDEITRLANEVAGFVKQGYPKKDLLLLHSNGNGVKVFTGYFPSRLLINKTWPA